MWENVVFCIIGEFYNSIIESYYYYFNQIIKIKILLFSCERLIKENQTAHAIIYIYIYIYIYFALQALQTKNTRKNGKTEKNIQLPTGFDEFSRQALLGCYVLSSYQGYIIVWKPHLALSPNLTLKLRTIQVLFHYFFAYIIGGISLYMWKKSKVSIFFPWNNLFWFVRYCFRLREIKGCLLFFSLVLYFFE